MTKVNIKFQEQRKDFLGELKIGDFFLDEDGHVCMYITYEIENLVWYYDFCLHTDRRGCRDKEVTYLNEVNISY